MPRVDSEHAADPRAAARAPITLSTVLEDGIFAGVIGAASVALWFFVLDVLHGRALYTPALLGTLVLRGPAAVTESVAIEPSPVAVYTCLHFLAFLIVGAVTAWLWELFDRHPAAGIGLLFGFVIFETGFFVADLAIGAHILGLIGAWAVGVANLLAAVGMGLYLWARHPLALQHLSRLWTEE